MVRKKTEQLFMKGVACATDLYGVCSSASQGDIMVSLDNALLMKSLCLYLFIDGILSLPSAEKCLGV